MIGFRSFNWAQRNPKVFSSVKYTVLMIIGKIGLKPVPVHMPHQKRCSDLTMMERVQGGRLNIRTSSYQYRDPHVKDKTVSRPSYLLHGNPHTQKKRSLYWDGAQKSSPSINHPATYPFILTLPQTTGPFYTEPRCRQRWKLSVWTAKVILCWWRCPVRNQAWVKSLFASWGRGYVPLISRY